MPLHRCAIFLCRATKSPNLQRFFHRFLVSKCSQNFADQEEFYACLLRQSARTSNSNHGRAVHANLLKGSLPFSLFLYNHMINLYVKCGDLDNGLQLFDEMPERNVVSWSALMAGFVQHGHHKEALSFFSSMIHDGTTMPNEYTLVSALHACSINKSLTNAYQVYSFIIRLGFGSNVFLMNAFLTTLIRHGELAKPLEVFDNFPYKDIVSWNAMMAGYLQIYCTGLSNFCYRMFSSGVKPDNFTFASVFTGLAALSDIKLGLQVHGMLVKYGYEGDICVGNSLGYMYIKSGELLDGFKAFDEMSSIDASSWTQMANGCVHSGEPGRALQVIDRMRKMGVMPNKFTLATAFNACANLPSLEEGKKIHCLRIKLGGLVDVCVDNAILDMYAKCGCMASTRLIFESMIDRSVVSWTSMIMGCAKNGHAREATEIFERMRLEGLSEPNHITFVCLLYACSQGGFIEEGWKYFTSMTSDYKISPLEDHYAIMVNLLGQAGRTREAEELIQEMPFEPGKVVWQTLLSACQVHGDMETAVRATEKALDLDKNDPSTYVLLSNMFAGFNNWDNVGILRELMETRDVKKVPGWSWIAVANNHVLVDPLIT